MIIPIVKMLICLNMNNMHIKFGLQLIYDSIDLRYVACFALFLKSHEEESPE